MNLIQGLKLKSVFLKEWPRSLGHSSLFHSLALVSGLITISFILSACTIETITANFSSSASATRTAANSTDTTGSSTSSSTFKITGAIPNRGSFATANTIVIQGKGFSTSPVVTVGGLSCAVDSQTSGSTVITCVTSIGGSSVKGAADIVVTNSDGTSTTLTGGFTYLDYPPVISSAGGAISPTSASITGGGTITILGSNFVAGTSGTTVKMGLATCTNPFYTGTTQIMCTIPANAVGPVSITVTNPDGQTATKSSAFMYYGSLPTISAVTPSSGSSGVQITVTSGGYNFASGATVTVGGQSCTNVSVVSGGGYLTCYTPSLAPGAADVIVTNADGQSSAAFVGGYTYQVTGNLLATGDYHTCNILNGAGYCWGKNDESQLGAAVGATSKVPYPVTSITSGVQSIASGPSHSCAVTNGSAFCWGKGTSGRLGNNDAGNASSTTPVQVAGLTSGVQAIAAGGDGHSCAIQDGSVMCWGYNNKGQLGNNDGTYTASNVPVQANGLTSGATAIAVGTSHTCAIVNGGAKCWGYNVNGQIGDGTSGGGTDKISPTNVTGLTTGVQAIGAGNGFSCALHNGAVKCWGANSSGQLGNNSTTPSSTAVTPTGLSSGVRGLAVGYAHACALVNGGVKCWGANDSSQLGVTGGAGSYKTIPTDVNSLSTGAQLISAGREHTCAIVNNGVKCWGLNSSGQLGNNSTTASSVPSSIYGTAQGISRIAAGSSHTCAVTNGTVKCWGRNDQGQLGNTLGTDQSSPTSVAGISSGAQELSTGYSHTCGIINGTVMCWGDMTNGKTGQSSGSSLTQSTPASAGNIASGSGAKSISVGYGNSCAILNGGLQCWGDNTYGQLGNGSGAAYSNAAVSATGLTTGVSTVSVGGYHVCAILNGSAKCWGRNNVGQLGDTTTTSSSTPVQVNGITAGAQAIAAGLNHGCAIASGSVKCWGDNTYGQVGSNSNNANEATPVQVTGVTAGATVIVAGANHACALVNGGVKCWGRNTYGQLGNNDTTYTDSKVPVNVNGLTSGVQDLIAGDDHTCALTNGAMKCWGLNTYGQLGVSSTTTPKSPTPVSVSGL